MARPEELHLSLRELAVLESQRTDPKITARLASKATLDEAKERAAHPEIYGDATEHTYPQRRK